MIIHDYDRNQNGGFEPEEIKNVRKEAFSNLKNFGYFTHVKISGKPFEVKYVKTSNAKIVKDRVVYHFFVPCHVKAAGMASSISLAGLLSILGQEGVLKALNRKDKARPFTGQCRTAHGTG